MRSKVLRDSAFEQARGPILKKGLARRIFELAIGRRPDQPESCIAEGPTIGHVSAPVWHKCQTAGVIFLTNTGRIVFGPHVS